MADDSYLSMLNNPYINPPPPQQQQKEEKTVTKANREPVFKTAEKAGKELLDSCKDLYLISETDASWQSIQKPWTSLTKGDDDELPNTLDELISIGLVDKEQINEPFKIKSLNAFFDPMMDKQDDPYQQADRYCQLYQQCKSILGNDAKVYLVGSTTILVLILGLVKENDQKALIGLQSELVQT
ncbi:hypothetical protein BJ944DRAFT_263593 [Cunninghamella echinulata]|nr:hypothetical protein BJ944DRAFT_263593 [Cunninghamella echinulata]